jgi:hypothetical protein
MSFNVEGVNTGTSAGGSSLITRRIKASKETNFPQNRMNNTVLFAPSSAILLLHINIFDTHTYKPLTVPLC